VRKGFKNAPSSSSPWPAGRPLTRESSMEVEPFAVADGKRRRDRLDSYSNPHSSFGRRLQAKTDVQKPHRHIEKVMMTHAQTSQ